MIELALGNTITIKENLNQLYESLWLINNSKSTADGKSLSQQHDQKGKV